MAILGIIALIALVAGMMYIGGLVLAGCYLILVAIGRFIKRLAPRL